ncbi:2-oxoglutarate dehydrogenase, E2 component, dihydrolipoamide succinyltransferase [Nocardioides sp. InS609-2]|uniref:2-oxoglutarate dehydrogenase, E2 component, dihydrolipoamide succinyltransferase n=1 Tax=Nocardioides sp. InS609-2 TaxID=2760705 RepID=UPI0020BF7E7F|nr:2-oxoglutarate dehydrogenase, E2 component, dihydrolipoamide succinyltransferase [Nocardioides sp. InS609-2]
MASEVTLPALGESVTEGTVTRWLKQVGDAVAIDEPLLEVSTDKVDTEIPSPVAGTLLEIKANEDDTVEVGAVLAIVGEEGEGGGSASSDESSTDESSSDSEAGGGEDVQQEAAEVDAEERDSSGEAPSEQAEPEQAEPEKQEEEPAEQPAAEQDAPSGDSGGGGGSGTSVTLPALGESVTEGTVTRWLKQVGDDVAVDEPLLEVSTDKVDTEIPSPVAGKLLEIKVSEDETVEIGAELAVIGSGDGAAAPEPKEEEAAPEPEKEAEEAPESEPEPEPEKAPAPEPEPEKTPEPVAEKPAEPEKPAAAPRAAEGSGDQSSYVTPLVRKMATENGVDLSAVTGTGVGGRIRKQDVLDAAAAQKAPAAEAAPAAAPAAAPSAPAAASAAPSPLRGKTEPLSRLRKVIAKRMVESLQVSAQLTTVVEVDVTAIARLRASVKDDFAAREGVKLSFMPFFAKAAIDALKQHPSLNATIDTEKGEVTYFDRENLAIAVDTEKGLLTPVIKEAGDLSIAGLARKIADVAERTRTNKITPDDLSGGTFTLTNTGSRGALFDTPIINQPQVAILGTGSIVKRPVVIDDANLGETIAVRSMVYLALTYDHRLVDGADAARYLTEVKQRLEAGQFDL